MKKGNILIYIVVGIIIIAALFVFFYHPSNNLVNPITIVKPNTQISATTVNVAKFYDGQDGYFLAIPSGNSSTCIWTWADGSANIPDLQTTTANTATAKHTIHISDTADDWKVSCVDDFGNRYVGVFPK